jgi:hypothetical protein
MTITGPMGQPVFEPLKWNLVVWELEKSPTGEVVRLAFDFMYSRSVGVPCCGKFRFRSNFH